MELPPSMRIAGSTRVYKISYALDSSDAKRGPFAWTNSQR
jgi:hypothetical protein